jgi:hypothetical protein
MNSEVLCEDEYQAAVNRTATSYDTVAKELLLLHTEVMAAVLLEHVILFKRALVEQHLNALTGCIFSFVVLLLDGFFTTSEASLFALLDKLLDFL